MVWLQDELAAHEPWYEAADLATLYRWWRDLHHWKCHPDLSSIRDCAATNELSDPDRKACDALWTSVVALLERVKKQLENQDP